MKRRNTLGGLYFLIHFMIEITSFYVLTCCTGSPFVWVLMLLYDFTAFVPQGVFGYLRDRGIYVNFALWGSLLAAASVLCLMLGANMFLTVTVLSVGNCMVHAHGAEVTLRGSDGHMSPSALFVSGGSFGVVTGKLLSLHGVAAPWVLGMTLLALVPILIAERLKEPDGAENLWQYHFDNPRIATGLLVVLAVFVVAVRAYMGYGIPTAWNKTELQTVALYVCMGVGKAMGGVLIDRIGIRKTAFISTVGALPLLLFGDELMAVSLVGIAFFSMTMAVTLAVLTSRLQTLPGVAFGFTTLGLFLGTAPMFFFRIHSVVAKCIMIAALTVLCVLVLGVICAKQTNKTQVQNRQEEEI